MTTLSDSELVRRVLEGEIDLYEELIQRHHRMVFAIVRHRVRAGDAETVAHDVFVEAYRSLPTFAGRKPFANWLCRIAVRACCNYWRASARSHEAHHLAIDDAKRTWIEQAAAAPSIKAFAAETARTEAADVLAWACGHLSPEDRMAVDLLYLQGWSLRETADALDWSIAKTKVRAFRARRTLRRVIEEGLGGT